MFIRAYSIELEHSYFGTYIVSSQTYVVLVNECRHKTEADRATDIGHDSAVVEATDTSIRRVDIPCIPFGCMLTVVARAGSSGSTCRYRSASM